MNLFGSLPGIFHFIESVYGENKPRNLLSIIIFLLPLAIFPLINFTNQRFIKRFRTAFQLSQTGFFCAVINAIFYCFSLIKPLRDKFREIFKERFQGQLFILGIHVIVVVIYSRYAQSFISVKV